MIKITWKPAPGESGSALVLADVSPARGPGSKICVSREREFTNQIQASAPPRGEAIELFDRANRTTAYGFTVTYEFATYSQCDQFCDDLGARLVGKGVLQLDYSGGGTRSLLGCWTNIRPSNNGVSAIVTYQFLGGAFTTGPASNLVAAI